MQQHSLPLSSFSDLDAAAANQKPPEPIAKENMEKCSSDPSMITGIL